MYRTFLVALNIASYNRTSFTLGNTAKPKIVQLSYMVRNVMSKFKVPLKYHDWVKNDVLVYIT